MSTDVRFDGRVVVVTGAGAGLGRAYALLFASRGASVVVNDLGGRRDGDGSDSKVADAVVDEIRKNGGTAVANYDSVLDGGNIIKTAIDAYGRIDIVVNNAGILRDKSFVRMTPADWNIIQDVHVKGAVNTTQAAWPYFRKQRYGRVIVTASNSGLYGNFGQANYSAAKSALVGLANTLAIEGASHNIHTNVIVPTAASRLTEDIVPPDFFNQLKPELIAPVVLWLCHEDCGENGTIIESAVGWAAKYELVRSVGCNLRRDTNAPVILESVRDNWEKVVDMRSAKHYGSIGEATGELLNVLEDMKSGKSHEVPKHVYTHSYNNRDIILYAIGVGATKKEPTDFRYLYENDEHFSVLPTYYVIYGPMGCGATSILDNVIPGVSVDVTRVTQYPSSVLEQPHLVSHTQPTLSQNFQILHGEQYLKVHKALPVESKVETRYTVQDALDKGKNAVVLIQHETFDVDTGDKLVTGQMVLVCRGAGGFSGPRKSSHEIPVVAAPTGKPDAVCEEKTGGDQAVLYRLNGDLNPLHIDSNIATMSGFEEPILHGLCSLGYATRHVLKTYAGGQPELFDAVKVRFAKHVIPGETLRTNMWQNKCRIHFETIAVERNEPVITGAYIDLTKVVAPKLRPNKCFMKDNLESDAIFAGMIDSLQGNVSFPKPAGDIFVFDVTSHGELMKQWTVDLKRGQIYEGSPNGITPDATLRIDDRIIIQIALGQLNLQKPYRIKDIGVEGNLMLLHTLNALTDSRRPKL